MAEVNKGFKELQMYFKNEIWPIHPYGEIESGSIAFAWVIWNKETDSTDKILTKEELKLRYTDYVKGLEQFQNGKYTKKEHRIITPDKWIEDKMYQAPIVRKIDPVDRYLFGDHAT